jgi:hypothetical protein
MLSGYPQLLTTKPSLNYFQRPNRIFLDALVSGRVMFWTHFQKAQLTKLSRLGWQKKSSSHHSTMSFIIAYPLIWLDLYFFRALWHFLWRLCWYRKNLAWSMWPLRMLLLAIYLGHVQTRWPLRIPVYQTYQTSGTHCSRPVETHLLHASGLHEYELVRKIAADNATLLAYIARLERRWQEIPSLSRLHLQVSGVMKWWYYWGRV